MNTERERSRDSYHSLLLLSEIAQDEAVSQRELSKRLGIAVGLVNSYLKNLVGKGFIRVKSFPRNRYAYLLTPKGIAEKSRLAYEHLSYFTSLYTVTRQDYLNLFRSLQREGVATVAFCGVDEVAEIAYLSLSETGLELVAVMDEPGERSNLFGMPIQALTDGLKKAGSSPIVLTSLKRGDFLRHKLHSLGMTPDSVFSVRAD